MSHILQVVILTYENVTLEFANLYDDGNHYTEDLTTKPLNSSLLVLNFGIYDDGRVWEGGWLTKL